MKEMNSYFAEADLKKNCDYACPQKCNTIDYELEVSSATYPNFLYLKKLQSDKQFGRLILKNVSDNELKDFGREGMLKLIVNYENLYYTSIDESPKITFETLFGTLGGHLGFFIGLSILSFIEIVELLIELMLILIEHRKKAVVGQVANYPFFNRSWVKFSFYFIFSFL
jgi:hypothetical protein